MGSVFGDPEAHLVVELPAAQGLALEAVIAFDDKTADDLILGFEGLLFADADVVDAGIPGGAQFVVVGQRADRLDRQAEGEVEVVIDLGAG